MPEFQIDEVGVWTEIKLQIIREYAAAYAKILNNQPSLSFDYIDGFAGAGENKSKSTGEIIDGSPAIALQINPPFHHYHFIDLNGQCAARLRNISIGRENVSVYEGDCNSVLLEKVFPQCRYEDYRRALCLLDPYELNPRWEVIQKAGEMRSIEIFLNFMIMDANRNVLLKNPDGASTTQKQRMNAFWGDDSWREVGYTKGFLIPDLEKKAPNEKVVEAYRKRLIEKANFKYVSAPLPMKTSRRAVIYYLLFASQNETGYKIARSIMDKYRD